MAKRRLTPVNVVVDGAEKVAIDPDDYDRLARAHRQLGGQMNRVSILKQHIHALETALAALGAVVATHAGDHGDDCTGCVVRRIIEAVPALPGPDTPAGRNRRSVAAP
jgi:hypothetical protein